jgi:hypothetical protein
VMGMGTRQRRQQAAWRSQRGRWLLIATGRAEQQSSTARSQAQVPMFNLSRSSQYTPVAEAG